MALTKPQGDMVIKRGTLTSLSSTITTVSGIPEGTTFIEILVISASTNGTGIVGLQLGDSGGPEATGYTSVEQIIRDGLSSFVSLDPVTTCFRLTDGSAQATDAVAYSRIQLSLVDPATNKWMVNIQGTNTVAGGTRYMHTVVGTKSLTGVLDRVSLVTDGVDTFDTGTITVNYI